MAKQIQYGIEARKSLEAGVNKLPSNVIRYQISIPKSTF